MRSQGIQQAADKEPGEEILPFSDEPSLGNYGDPDYWMSRFQTRNTEPEPEDSADNTTEEEPGSLQFDSRAWRSDYYMLARKHLYGAEEQKPDYEKVMPLLLLEASRGNGFAYYDIGRMYLLGLGCNPDEEEAQKWFRDALEVFRTAEASDEKGYLQYRIGKCYAYGHGTEQNYEEAVRWFRLAVGEGNSYAEYQLGKIYFFGNGVRADREKGLEYLKISAEHGNEYAANLLQVIHTQHSQGAASCAASLIARLGQIFQEKKKKKKLHHRMDRKQRREIEEKKQALGQRSRGYEYDYNEEQTM